MYWPIAFCDTCGKPTKVVDVRRCPWCREHGRDPSADAIHVVCDNYACDKYDGHATCIPNHEIWQRIDLGS